MSVVDWFVRSPGAATVDVGPPPLDVRAYRGDSLDLRFNFRTTDDEPYPLTGTWEAQIRDAPEATASTAFVVDAAAQGAGIIDLHLEPAATLILPARSVWDLQNVNDQTKTWAVGTLYVSGEVTR